MGSDMPGCIPGLGPMGMYWPLYTGGARVVGIATGGPVGADVDAGWIGPGIPYVIGEGCTEPG